MHTQDHVPAGAPCWIDHHGPDPDAATAFYAGLLGWEVEGPSAAHGGYWNFMLGGRQVAGAMPTPPEVRAGWTTYLATDDIERSVELVDKEGGQLGAGPHAVGDLGAFAVCVDPADRLTGWVVVLGAADVAATTARAVAAGASVLRPPVALTAAPGAHSTADPAGTWPPDDAAADILDRFLAVLRDSQGAVFALVSAPAGGTGA